VVIVAGLALRASSGPRAGVTACGARLTWRRCLSIQVSASSGTSRAHCGTCQRKCTTASDRVCTSLAWSTWRRGAGVNVCSACSTRSARDAGKTCICASLACHTRRRRIGVLVGLALRAFRTLSDTSARVLAWLAGLARCGRLGVQIRGAFSTGDTRGRAALRVCSCCARRARRPRITVRVRCTSRAACALGGPGRGIVASRAFRALSVTWRGRIVVEINVTSRAQRALCGTNGGVGASLALRARRCCVRILIGRASVASSAA
jgi:hypothetical protein